MQSLALNHTKPERFDLALAQALGVSRAKAQRLIKDGTAQIQGKIVTPHLLLPPGTIADLTAETNPTKPKAGSPLVLDVLFEDDDVLVVNKPAGVLVHPTATSHEYTLLDAVLAHTPTISEVGDDRSRAGIVHRLDKDASGVIVVAKNTRAFRHLKEQFSERKTKKSYTVLVLGEVMDKVGTITFPIARSTTRARMAARPLSQEGKEAITHYTVEKYFTTSTLLDVQIETGRTHQIRAHFFALGFPVAGDTVYVRKGVKHMDIPRLFLHARELSLELPSGETKTFIAPLPTELKQIMSKLKPKAGR